MHLQCTQTHDTGICTLSGKMTTQNYGLWQPQLTQALHDIQHMPCIKLHIDDFAYFDLSSPFLCAHIVHTFAKNHDNTVQITGEKHAQLIINQLTLLEKQGYNHLTPQHTHGESFTHTVGQRVMQWSYGGRRFLDFIGALIVWSIRCITQPQKFPLNSLTHHIRHTGLYAVPIVALISFLIGMVLTYQGINQLIPFGAEIYTVDFLTLGVFRELGVLLTAIVVAGRSSSAYTTHIGIMTLNQETDALRVMNLDPIVYLAIPRITAILITLPLLVFIADMMALLGGMFVTYFVIGLHPVQFIGQLRTALTPTVFFVGMSKAPLFALIIGCIGCFRGLVVKPSAESVGHMTTTSVVQSIFYVIICNAFMSLIFSYLGV